jgi:threonine dehydrogenase-like Zn-dependent dehydrogenase
MTRHRGVVGLGLFSMNQPRPDVRPRRPFVGSRAYGPGLTSLQGGQRRLPDRIRADESHHQQEFLREVAKGVVSVADLAPTRVPIEDAARAYEILRSPDRPPTVLIDYGRGA